MAMRPHRSLRTLLTRRRTLLVATFSARGSHQRLDLRTFTHTPRLVERAVVFWFQGRWSIMSLRERSLTGALRSIRSLHCALTAPGKALALHRPKLRPLAALRGPLDRLIPCSIRGHRPTRRRGLQPIDFSNEISTFFGRTNNPTPAIFPALLSVG